MKILQIVNPSLPFPVQTSGGTERIVEYLIEELINNKHEITLMGHNDSKVDSRIRFIPIGTYSDRKNTLGKIWLHLLTNKYDVIHNHGRLIYFLPVMWGRVRKLHTFHTAELDGKSFRRFIDAKPTNLTYSPCAKWIQDKYEYIGGNWNYVNNSLPLAKYTFSPTSITDDLPLVIICRMGPTKGVTDAIKIARLGNRKLIIAGIVGDYPHEIEWFNQAVWAECDDKISFIGPVDDQQKNELLKNAAALLMLSNTPDAFNLTLLEANACGCPVLSFDRYFAPTFILHGTNGFIGSSTNDLVYFLPQLKNINRINCRMHFEKYYTSRLMAKRYLELYNLKVR